MGVLVILVVVVIGGGGIKFWTYALTNGHTKSYNKLLYRLGHIY